MSSMTFQNASYFGKKLVWVRQRLTRDRTKKGSYKDSTEMLPLRERSVWKHVVFILVLLSSFGLGFLAARLSTPVPSSSPSPLGDEEIGKLLMEEIKAENIEAHHRNLTKARHMSGTSEERAVVDYISHFWRQLPLDNVSTTPYDVLLTQPDPTNPNTIRIHDKQGGVVFETMSLEDSLKEHPEYQGYNAYSPSKTVKGPLVYINYGRPSDFKVLVDRGVEMENKICLIRYGFNFRSNKVKMAEEHGCIGVILFSDPDDYVKNVSRATYPHTWWLPGDGVQRGTVKISSGGLGDPLTPYYPSTPEAYRINRSETDLPTIPCQPISYNDATHLLSIMRGDEVGDGWRGLLNVTYRYGPALDEDISHVELSVNNLGEQKEIRNVLGFIRGRQEPDRYVMLGNHHDAWVYGGADPNSGTAVLLELARAVASVVARGAWQPRRTIVFCSWGAEEHGLIGSIEFVEQYGKILSQRAVAYFNVDSAVQGRHVFLGKALPMLNEVLFNATKKVTNPDDSEYKAGRKSVYDTWLHRSPDNDLQVPRVSDLGSGSDFAAFVSSLGVPCTDIRFFYDRNINISSYPLYHTAYDTYHSFSTFHDPAYKFSRALGQVWVEMARSLSSAPLLPLHTTHYSQFINRLFKKFTTKFSPLIHKHNILLTSITDALEMFTEASNLFDQSLQELDLDNALLLRGRNDQLMQLERSFIDYMGLPGRPSTRHVLLAPSASNSYAASLFPGLSDALATLKDAPDDDPARIATLVQDVRKQVAIVSFFLKTASANLRAPELFAA